MSEKTFKEYWSKIDGRSAGGGTFYNELKKLWVENKAFKERDWEKCCQEFKETLVAENEALSNYFRFQIKENCRIAKKLNEVEGSRDELLKLLNRIADPNDYKLDAEIIEKTTRKAEALKEETK